MSYFVVATYFRDDAFGGPEEGGWWYSTYELDQVVAGTSDEDFAWELAQDWNEMLDADHDRHGGARATVVELGRRQLKPEYQDYGCHGGDDLWDEHGNVLPEYSEVRWDVPVYTPENRPHYC